MKSTGSQASPQSMAPAPSAPRPSANTLRLPWLSPRTPAASSAAASPTDIALSIHALAPGAAPMSAAVRGSVAIGVT